MRIFTSPIERNQWLVQPYRGVEKGAGSESIFSSQLLKQEYSAVSILRQSDAIYYGLSQEEGVYDFGLHFQNYCFEAGMQNAIYLEYRAEDDSILYVNVRDYELKLDKLSAKESALREVKSHIEKTDGDTKLLSFGLDKGELIELFHADSKVEVEEFSASLSDTLRLRPSLQFTNTHTALRNMKRKRPWLLYALLAIFALSGAYYLAGDDTQEVTKQEHADPYHAYYHDMKSNVLQVLNRMSQDYNNHVALMTLAGWKLEKVSHTKGQVSYSVKALPDAEIAELERFAKENKMHVLVEQGKEVSLLSPAANVTPYTNDSDIQMYDVVEVHHFLSDAVYQYMPNASLEFIRDVPKGGSTGKRWVIRELELKMTGLFKEDLLLLGSITNNNLLPVSFGGDLSDPNVGQYVVDKERFTGGLKISIYGEKP